MQISIQAKQSKVHKELKATKVPEISQAQLVYKSKLNQNETKVNSQHKQINVQCTKVQATRPKHKSQCLQNKLKVSHKQAMDQLQLSAHHQV